MTFRETFYNVKQLMVNRLIDFGLEDADIDMGWTTLLTLAQNTRITINVPLNLTYSDDFSITGTLETATYRRLSNKTLKLKVGNTVVATTETDINGAYSFTTSPVSMGNHSFQVIFEGTNVHNASESSIVNRVIGKETSVINIETIPTAHLNGSTIITGTLESDDVELIKEATIKLDTPSGTTLTDTTNQYGQFSFTVTDISSFNGVYVDCYFEGDNYYAESSIRIPIPVYQETLALTSDKDILSYADEEYATLSAQYKDTGDMNLGSGKQIDIYQIYEVDDIDLSSDKDILSYADTDDTNYTLKEYATISAQLTMNDKKVKVSEIPIVFQAYKQEDDTLINSNWKIYSNSYITINSESDISEETIEDGDTILLVVNSINNTPAINAISKTTGSIIDSISFNDLYTEDVIKIVNENSSFKIYINDVLSDFNVDSTDSLLKWDSQTDFEITVIEHYRTSTSYTQITDVNGISSVSYRSQGIGDIYISAEVGGFVSESYAIQDCVLYDTASSDKVSAHFGSAISLRSGGSASVSFDSTNSYYKITQSANGDCFIPITALEGLDDIIIEYDAKIDYDNSYGVGVCVYPSSSNWGAIAKDSARWTLGKTVNGTYTYSQPTASITQSNWYHFKITITNDTVTVELYSGTTLVSSQNETYSSSWFTNATKIGINHMWGSGRVTPLKNITVKPL